MPWSQQCSVRDWTMMGMLASSTARGLWRRRHSCSGAAVAAFVWVRTRTRARSLQQCAHSSRVLGFQLGSSGECAWMTWPDARTKGPFINDFVSKSIPFFLLLYIKAVGFLHPFPGFYKYPQSKLDPSFWPLHIADVECWWPLILSVAYSQRQSGHVWRDTLFESTRILSSSWARQPTSYTYVASVRSVGSSVLCAVAKLATMC
jgi:hypothetical protein